MSTKTKTTLLIENMSLAKDLARVTAERDSGAGKCTPEHTWKQWTDELHAELSQVKIELDEANENIRKGTYAYLDERYCCNGAECGCGGVTRLQQMVLEECGDQLAALRRENKSLRAERDLQCKLKQDGIGGLERLRARVAELESAADKEEQHRKGCVRLMARVYEMEQALESALGGLCAAAIKDGTADMIQIALHRKPAALARAESATPAKQEAAR